MISIDWSANTTDRRKALMEMRIWEARTKKNLTLVQLAKKTGLSKSFLQLAETNQRSPRICDLEKIAKALDCRIQDLYDSEYK